MLAFKDNKDFADWLKGPAETGQALNNEKDFRAWLFSEKTNNQIQSAILSLRKLSEGLIRLKFPDKNHTFTDDYKETCNELIITILESIFSNDEKFSQAEDAERCKYCSFKTICNR